MRPCVGFLGTGWIGRNRMEAMLADSAVEAVAICDPSPDMAGQAAQLAPGAARVDTLAAMLDLGLDGLVIASPSALHAAQSIEALARGVAVFCQKPLGRSAAETRDVVEAARNADHLLGVDFSYRRTEAMTRIRDLVAGGALGAIFAVDLVFHNGYGPDKPWFYDRAQSGGGCVMDLGVHLVDLALDTLGFPAVTDVSANLYAGGLPLRGDEVEDYAVATITLATGAVVRLACSWRLPVGQEAVISAAFHGTRGGAAMRNVDGGFYDFVAEHHQGTGLTLLAAPPDAWGGRAAADWAARLAAGARFDPKADRFVEVAAVLDRIYEAAGQTWQERSGGQAVKASPTLRRTAMNVSDVMTKQVETVSPRQTIREAAELMRQLDTGVLPVGENDRLVGMVTDRDIVIRSLAQGRGPDSELREAMTESVLYCFEDDSIEDAAKQMGDAQVRRLPVMNRDKRLVGIIALGDLAEVADSGIVDAALTGISAPEGDVEV